MRKTRRWFGVLILAVLLVGCISLLADKQQLRDDLIRLHVVANSDSEKDQQVKLLVRDAVISYLEPLMQTLSDKEQAMQLLQEKQEYLEEVANHALIHAGSTDRAVVSISQEAFATRKYETFSLPAGIYDSLRIEIGEGIGKNWWCVVFPSLCIPATTQGMQTVAVSAGFDDTLTNTLTGEDGYEIRFFLLDCLGKLENFLKS